MREELTAVGIRVIAASADAQEHAETVAAEVSFPVGFGVNEGDASRLGAWWEANRKIIQPSELLIARDGKILAATYSSGPLGRVSPEELLRLVTMMEKRKQAPPAT